MLREFHTPSLSWPDKTMSVIQQRQLEACEMRLRRLPSFGLFNGCTEENVDQLRRISYDAREHLNPPGLMHVADLTLTVMRRLPAEALLLTMPEFELVQQLLNDRDGLRLTEWHETAPAESLVRRLWCSVQTGEGGDSVSLRMEPQFRLALMRLMGTDEYRQLRMRITQLNIAVICALNVYGILYADDVFDSLGDLLLGFDISLAERMLKIAFDYCLGRDGKMVLLHPALADPEKAMQGLFHVDLRPYAEVDPAEPAPQMLLSDTEHQAMHRLCALIEDSLRPDYSAYYCVEDLRFLAKQSVSFDTLAEVLAAQLAVRPTDDMLDGLRQLQVSSPGFVCMLSRKVH
ncbi:MAG: hypothetical protein IKS31_00305 [Clostridia bacterium]|nr:hypothetical protein [Clostridia bacterium]